MRKLKLSVIHTVQWTRARLHMTALLRNSCCLLLPVLQLLEAARAEVDAARAERDELADALLDLQDEATALREAQGDAQA